MVRFILGRVLDLGLGLNVIGRVGLMYRTSVSLRFMVSVSLVLEFRVGVRGKF